MSETGAAPGSDADPTTQGTPFTTHELLYMLSLNDTEAAAITREHLRLGDPVEEGTPLYAAGASTLMVRGFLAHQGDRLVPQREAQVLVGLMTSADRWVEIGLLGRRLTDGEEVAEGALVIAFRQYAGLFAANTLGIFTGLSLQSSDVIPQVTSSIINRFAGLHRPGAASVNVTDATGKRRGVFHIADDETWRYATDPVDEDGELTARDIDAGEVDAVAEALVLGTGADGGSDGDRPAG